MSRYSRLCDAYFVNKYHSIPLLCQPKNSILCLGCLLFHPHLLLLIHYLRFPDFLASNPCLSVDLLEVVYRNLRSRKLLFEVSTPLCHRQADLSLQRDWTPQIIKLLICEFLFVRGWPNQLSSILSGHAVFLSMLLVNFFLMLFEYITHLFMTASNQLSNLSQRQ